VAETSGLARATATATSMPECFYRLFMVLGNTIDSSMLNDGAEQQVFALEWCNVDY
jgi:hypothetical protein